MNMETLQNEIVELKYKLCKSEYEVNRLGSLVDRLTREIERMERSNWSDDDE